MELYIFHPYRAQLSSKLFLITSCNYYQFKCWDMIEKTFKSSLKIMQLRQKKKKKVQLLIAWTLCIDISPHSHIFLIKFWTIINIIGCNFFGDNAKIIKRKRKRGCSHYYIEMTTKQSFYLFEGFVFLFLFLFVIFPFSYITLC